MAADQPIVVYAKDNKRVSKKKADRIADEWAKNRKPIKKGEKISLTDYFSKK